MLITDPAAPDVRPTLDIDVIVEVATLTDYYRLQERLRGKGFREAVEENVICRWRHGEIVLDVMPTDERILGFSNRWYAESLRNAQQVTIEDVKAGSCLLKLEIRAPDDNRLAVLDEDVQGAF